jgi:crotonobetainyl-CoA:carnitine CoA-transferase CaiB-like acyl-CoA transferase
MKNRYSQRVPVEGSVVFSGDEVTGQGRVIDVSLPGCLMETPEMVKPGDYVHLKLTLADQKTMTVPLAVVRWADGNRIGVEFIRSSEQDQAHLTRLVQRHRVLTSLSSWQGGIELIAAAGD